MKFNSLANYHNLPNPCIYLGMVVVVVPEYNGKLVPMLHRAKTSKYNRQGESEHLYLYTRQCYMFFCVNT